MKEYEYLISEPTIYYLFKMANINKKQFVIWMGLSDDCHFILTKMLCVTVRHMKIYLFIFCYVKFSPYMGL